MRQAPRRDANERDIVSALERAGCLVQPLSAPGVPDLLVCCPRGTLRLIEVKDGGQPPSARRLTPAQVAWHTRWTRHGAQVAVVCSVDEALAAVRD